MFYYKLNLGQGDLSYPFNTNTVFDPLYDLENRVMVFKSEERLNEHERLTLITESEYTVFNSSSYNVGDSFDVPMKQDPELESPKEENEALKLRLAQTERLAADTNLTQQQLIELLVDMEVI